MDMPSDPGIPCLTHNVSNGPNNTSVPMRMYKTFLHCPGQVAQLVGASSPAQKGWGFDPQSGHIPRLQVQSLVRCVREATDQCFSLSLKSMKISSGKDFFFLTKRFSALTIKTKTKKLELILSKSTEENTLCYTHIDLHVLVRGK